MGIVLSVGDDDREARQFTSLDITVELSEVDHFAGRTVHIVDHIAVPGGSVMAAIIRRAIVIVRSGNGASRCSVGLGVDLP